MTLPPHAHLGLVLSHELKHTIEFQYIMTGWRPHGGKIKVVEDAAAHAALRVVLADETVAPHTFNTQKAKFSEFSVSATRLSTMVGSRPAIGLPLFSKHITKPFKISWTVKPKKDRPPDCTGSCPTKNLITSRGRTSRGRFNGEKFFK